MHSTLVDYFKECYQSDNREQGFWDIFSKDFEFLRLSNSLERAALYEGNAITLDSHYATNLAASIETYRREKTFLYGCHFLIGKMSLSQGLGGRARRICAPLLLFDATLTKTGSNYTVGLDLSSARLNTTLFYRLVEDRDATHRLDVALSIEKISTTNWLEEWLNEHCNDVSVSRIKQNDANTDSLKSLQRKASTTNFALVDGGALLLSKNPLSSRGVIDELVTISQDTSISAPLEQLLLNKQNTIAQSKPSCLDQVPGILSTAQSAALKNAAEKTLSLIIGPPGTGKSYTIACIVLERFMQGESVLVVSENEFAVDVVQEKLVESLGLSSNAIIRAGSRDYLKHLKQTITDLIKGIGLEKPSDSLLRQLMQIKSEIHKDEKLFNSLYRSAASDGIILDRYIHQGKTASLLGRFRVWRQRSRFGKYGLLYDRLEKIKQDHRKREETLSRHINNVYLESIHRVLRDHRPELVRFNRALRARTSSRQEAVFSAINHSILLQALPVWLCSFSSLHKALPLKKELFDLVIIDEATQCNIASCIPALYRAKKAVVVGDPKQLRHISFLSATKQNVIQQKLGLGSTQSIDLNYRDKSMIDYANEAISSQHDLVMLDEHYRSLPEIIDFSNRMFYDGNLRIMTEKPVLNKNPPVEVINVANAKRVKGINIEEALAIIERLKCLVKEQQNIPEEYRSSIGVLTFFRDQAEKLQDLIFDTFDLAVITQHKLRAGTPYSFQGEERDMMLLSCAVDRNSAGGTYLYLNRPDVFNVSVTRARHLQLVFFSAEIADLPKNNLLRLFLESISRSTAPPATDILARDKNIEELTNQLRAQGMTIARNYPIAGIPMDLVAMLGTDSIAIDLVGFPGERRDILHLDRYKMFERAGLPIFPISYTGWSFARDAILNKIKNCFKALSQKSTGAPSLYQQSSHWTKLLTLNPGLSKTVSELELDLVDIKYQLGTDQLEKIIDRYYKLIWVLNQKLNPSELTYTRYASAAEDVFLGAIDNLRSLVLIHKSGSPWETNTELADKQVKLHNEQNDSIEQLLQANQSAIITLEEVAFKWSKLAISDNTSNKVFEDSLNELNHLAASVDQYTSK